MDSTRRQALNALREMFPTAHRIDLDVELSMHQNGVCEEMWSVRVEGLTPSPVTVVAPTMQEVMGRVLGMMAKLARPTKSSLLCLARLSLN